MQSLLSSSSLLSSRTAARCNNNSSSTIIQRRTLLLLSSLIIKNSKRAIATTTSLSSSSSSITTNNNNNTGSFYYYRSIHHRQNQQQQQCQQQRQLYNYNNKNYNNASLLYRYYSTTTTRKQNKTNKKKKKALVLGSSGALGSHIAKHLSTEHNIEILGADVIPELPMELTEDWELDDFCDLSNSTHNLEELTVQLTKSVYNFTNGCNPGLDAIICASGGWQGDPIIDNNNNNNHIDTIHETKLIDYATEYSKNVSTMIKMNLEPVIAAGFIAQHCMNTTSTNNHTVMIVMGATAALLPTPGMLGYGIAKSASHHIVQTIGACTTLTNTVNNKSLKQAGEKVRQYLPSLNNLSIIGILPITLDTAANRKYMDYSPTWTKPEHISIEIGKWIDKPNICPHSGSLIKVYANNIGEAKFELVR